MTDLQLSLIALGALIIAGVVLFNWWQERNLRKEAADHDEPARRDVLMDDFHIDTDALLRDEKPEPGTPDALDYEGESEPYVSSHEWRDTAAHAPEEETVSLVDRQEYALPEEVTHYGQPDLETRFASTQPIPVLQDIGIQQDEIEDVGIGDGYVAAAEPAPDSFDGLPESISHQIDLTAVLYLQQPASGAALRELVPVLSGLDKPFYAHGLDAGNTWHLLTREQETTEFTRAAYSLQLADRSGPVSRETLNRFQEAVDSIGYTLGAQVEWQGNPDPLNYAVELDQFCIDVDKMVGFHIVQGANGPFTGTKFRGLAEASGLVLGDNGAFQYVNEHGVLYSLVNQDNIPFTPEMLRTIVLRGISFQLDIPRVKNCAEVFNQMVLAAKQMESSLSAALVDDHQRPLGEVQIEKIRQQLKVIHSQMVARGVVPGSPTALRLFS